MTEVKFFKIYKKRRNLKSICGSKEKLELFWKVVFAGLTQEKSNNLGTFEMKELKPRKYMIFIKIISAWQKKEQ